MAELKLFPVIIPHLPEGIMDDILLRLPVRSLLVFKCVCKSWCSLISSMTFIQSHQKISREDNNFDRRIVVFKNGLRYPIKHHSLLSFVSETVDEALDFEVPIGSSDHAEIVGCCNGLVCILVEKIECVYLWNPSTRKVKKLPDMDDDLKSSFDFFCCGFGYDEANEDYKVVSIREKMDHVTIKREWMTNIYSLTSNSWKTIQMPKKFKIHWGNGDFVGRKLHWDNIIYDDFRNQVGIEIFCLDLVSELWETIVFPNLPYVGKGFDLSSFLGMAGGCLSVLYDFGMPGIDIWVLKEKSWVKTFHIPPYLGRCIKPVEVLCIGEEDRMVAYNGDSFRIYILKDTSYVYVNYSPYWPFYQAYICIESLVQLV